jgi:diheme cytochrome c
MKIKAVLIPILAAGVVAIFYNGPGHAADAGGQALSGLSGMVERGGKPVMLAERGSKEGDEDEEGERGENERFTAPESPLYKKECSSCHFLYQAGFLPARSWTMLLNASDKHFGEDLALDDKTKGELLSYLTANSAEKSDTEWSVKIMRSIGLSTPERITKIPYIESKHRKVRSEVFKRPSIKSFSNCGACHTKGAEGNFEEKTVDIPK